MSDGAIDFRTVPAMLHRARVETASLDLASASFRLVARPPDSGTAPVTLVLSGVSEFRWHAGAAARGDPLSLSVVGLERLAADDVWRLYAVPGPSAVLELSCEAIRLNGDPVTGVGRSFRDR
ncbi:MAG TPA: hypothetical protein VJ847_05910 [Gemmatimonadales bacterium]|jgi:hypothetical protein|nr:hypothetical protein [Gemmatimonadales bacterium]